MICTDNGTNFVGANTELRKEFLVRRQMADNETEKLKIQQMVANANLKLITSLQVHQGTENLDNQKFV